VSKDKKKNLEVKRPDLEEIQKQLDSFPFKDWDSSVVGDLIRYICYLEGVKNFIRNATWMNAEFDYEIEESKNEK